MAKGLRIWQAPNGYPYVNQLDIFGLINRPRHLTQESFMPSLDLHWVRSHFPALPRPVVGGVPVFFDGPGGSQIPSAVAESMERYLLVSQIVYHLR